LLGELRQLLVRLGVVAQHHLGELLDLAALGALLRDCGRPHFVQSALRGLLDEHRVLVARGRAGRLASGGGLGGIALVGIPNLVGREQRLIREEGRRQRGGAVCQHLHHGWLLLRRS